MKPVDGCDAEVVSKSDIFDADWYLSRYPDVAAIGIDPAYHYLWLGWRLGRDPGPNFSTDGYLDANPDIRTAGMNPLVHFLRHGVHEGRLLRRAREKSECRQGSFRRVAVFASFSAKGIVEDYVKIYLEALSKICGEIVFVVDNDIALSDRKHLGSIVNYIIAGRHGEYDFGSYKRGIRHLQSSGSLSSADELILCNDSCYGPLNDLSELFEKMKSRNLDFWGITQNTEFLDHIQSYFLVFKKKVFSDYRFIEFFDSVKVKRDVSQVVLSYEVPMTQHFSSMGFSWGTLIDKNTDEYLEIQALKSNMTLWPLFMIRAGSPFVKVKAFKATHCNYDGVVRTLDKIQNIDQKIFTAIWKHVDPAPFYRAASIAFSLIMPFHNRRKKIGAAIDSVLAQRHQNFELILIDDGSTDDTAQFLKDRYSADIQRGRIKLIQLAGRKGVSAARNAGLRLARNAWIGYVDSDNVIDPAFLEMFGSSIVEHPDHQTFYGWLRRASDGKVVGSHYNRKNLINGNFIDLGAFIHSKELYIKNGGFDENLKRLVDWDLIIRYTEKNAPICLPRAMLIYNDNESDTSRITVRESLDNARIAIRQKYRMPIRVTTLIPTYRHKDFIRQAVESALAQRGHIQHEILLCDDGSDDGTREIVAQLAATHSAIIQDVSNPLNLGISETFRRCIVRASGDFIAILEGDDTWTDPEKLHKQSQFLIKNMDCSMVFSKIKVRSLGSKTERFLARQEALTKNKLDGSDFLAEPSMNLIANFSSCLFKADLLRRAPPRLFQGRFNEIALAFYLERHGKIGYLNEVMSVYNQHSNGVWSGSTKEAQLASGLTTRQMVLDVADPKYANAIRTIIEERYRKPLSLLRAKPTVVHALQ